MFQRILGLVCAIMAAATTANAVVSAASNQPGKAAAPAACVELIVNGGFEQGASGWEVSSNGPYALVGTAFPHTGEYGAILGARNDADDQLAQVVSVPAGSTASLTFWWYVETEETSTEVWDKLDVSVAIQPEGQSTRVYRITNLSTAGSWQQAQVDLTAYSGQNIRLRWRATTDSDRSTDFFVDDISLEACDGSVATPTVTPTITLTASLTPTSTVTATATPTATATAAPAAMATATVTPAATATATVTPMATATATVTTTATATQTPTSTATATVSATVTPTQTATITLPNRVYLPLLARQPTLAGSDSGGVSLRTMP